MAESPEQSRLTPMQERFVAAYIGVAKGNGTEAARIAGYKKPAEQAYENLKKPHILARVHSFITAKAEYATADQVLSELSDVALSAWRDFLSIKRDRDGNEVEVKMDLTNKVRSLELLGKYHGLFTDRIEHQGGVSIEIIGVDTDKL